MWCDLKSFLCVFTENPMKSHGCDIRNPFKYQVTYGSISTSAWVNNLMLSKAGIVRDPLTGPPSHWSPISLVPFSLVPQLTHWSPNTILELIGTPSHWSPISLVPHLIGPPFHSSPHHRPIPMVPHLIGPPSHWFPISLVPQLISTPSHWSPN